MPTRFAHPLPQALLASTLLTLLTACYVTPDEGSRRSSFQPYAQTTVHGTPLRDYLAARLAVLLMGTPVTPADLDQRHILNPLSPAAAETHWGVTVALTNDGYYLTAGHCTDWTPLWLVVPTPRGWQLESARLVARAAPPGTRPRWDQPWYPDLAILKIEHPPQAAIPWATNADLAAARHVILVGTSDNGDPNAPRLNGLAFAAGQHLLDFPMHPQPPAPHRLTVVTHNAPCHAGDSGGPLVTPDGKLLGIHAGEMRTPFAFNIGHAIRPDPAWIQQTLAADRAAHPPDTPHQE